MKADIDYLLYLIREHGVLAALDMIDIETIDDGKDNTIKVICRTIKYSAEELEKVLVDKIQARETKTAG